MRIRILYLDAGTGFTVLCGKKGLYTKYYRKRKRLCNENEPLGEDLSFIFSIAVVYS